MYLDITQNNRFIIYQFLRNKELSLLIDILPLDREYIARLIENNIELQKQYFTYLKYGLYFNNTFLNHNLVKQIPIIKFQKRFLGNTDYIDCITTKDLTHAIMVGRDCYRRPFITIKYKCLDDKLENQYGDINININRSYLITIFQRYTDVPSTWCKAGCFQPILWESSTCLSNMDKKLLNINIAKLLEGEKPYFRFDPDARNGPMSIREMDCLLVK